MSVHIRWAVVQNIKPGHTCRGFVKHGLVSSVSFTHQNIFDTSGAPPEHFRQIPTIQHPVSRK